MQQVDSLSLMKVHEATDLSQARSAIILNGNITGVIVTGEILEHRFRSMNNVMFFFWLTTLFLKNR
ncbi:hypothetical protein ACULWP_003965 [Cronobacter turicensis]